MTTEQSNSDGPASNPNEPDAETAPPTIPVIEDTSAAQEAPVEDKPQESSGGVDEMEVIAFQLEPLPKLKNALQESEIYLPLDEEKNKELANQPVLPIPTTTNDRTEDILNATPNIDLETNKDSERWGNVLKSSGHVSFANDMFQGTVERPDAAFRQVVPSEKGPLAIGRPKLKEDTGGATWTGELAVLRVQSILGMGSTVQIPLWHSGFWVTLKAPAEADLLELNRRISEEKVLLGRMTHGLAYANSSVFYASAVMNFILEHVMETTLKPEVLSSKSLRDRIKSPDMQILAWGMACAIWPKGFPYARAVLDATGKETKVIRELIAVSKLMWTDTTSLTPWQTQHMAQRFGQSMTEEGLAKYQTEFTRGKGRSVKLHDRIVVDLKVPSLTEYINSGYKWVNNIVAMTDKAFTLPPGSPERDKYILEQGKATYMRQYAHWVEAVRVDETQVVDHSETLEKILDQLSSQDELRSNFFEGVKKFIEDCVISVIAITATEETDKSELPRFPNLLPIDAMSVFFILLVQKVTQIQNR